jgi:hypothetical protein
MAGELVARSSGGSPAPSSALPELDECGQGPAAEEEHDRGELRSGAAGGARSGGGAPGSSGSLGGAGPWRHLPRPRPRPSPTASITGDAGAGTRRPRPSPAAALLLPSEKMRRRSLRAGHVVGPREGSRSLSIPPDLKDARGDGKMPGVPVLGVAQKTGSLSSPVRVVLGVIYVHDIRKVAGYVHAMKKFSDTCMPWTQNSLTCMPFRPTSVTT